MTRVWHKRNDGLNSKYVAWINEYVIREKLANIGGQWDTSNMPADKVEAFMVIGDRLNQLRNNASKPKKPIGKRAGRRING